MLAATIVEPGRVEPREHADPIPGAGEVLVRVHAAGLNRADLSQVAGRYPPPSGAPPDIPGLELAGEVERPALARRASRPANASWRSSAAAAKQS